MALSKVVAFLYFYAIARIMGPHATGVYFFSVSVTSIFTILADLGITPVVIRSIASDDEKSARAMLDILEFGEAGLRRVLAAAEGATTPSSIAPSPSVVGGGASA